MFLILITILTPLVRSLHLATTFESTYGLFGYCKGNSCLKSTFPYTIPSSEPFKSDASVRNTMVKLFIMAPISAFLALLLLICAAIGAFLPNLTVILPLIFVVLLFLTSVVATVGIILAFYPKVDWLGWLSVAASGSLLLALVFLVLASLNSQHDHDGNDDTNSLDDFDFNNDLDIGKSRSNLGFQPPPSSTFMAASKGGYTMTTASASAQSNDNSNSSINRTYNDKQPPMVNTTSNTVYSSLYNEKPQTQTDITNHHQLPYPATGNAIPDNHNDKMLLDVDVDGYNFNDKGYDVDVDDDDLDFSNMQRQNQLHDSDLDLDFTSVLQRPPNPNYPNTANYQPSYGFQPQHQQQLPQQQLPQQQFQQQVPSIQQPQYYSNSQPVAHNIVNSPSYAATSQQYSNYYSNNYVRNQPQGPTISDTVLSANPDFQLAGASAHKRRNNGFVPPSQRYNKPGMSR